MTARLPQVWSEAYQSMTPLVDRGRYFRCDFCGWGFVGVAVDQFNPDEVVQILDHIQEMATSSDVLILQRSTRQRDIEPDR